MKTFIDKFFAHTSRYEFLLLSIPFILWIYCFYHFFTGHLPLFEEKILYAVTLSSEWEKILDDSCQRTELGTMFLLNPLQVQELIETTASTLMRAHQSIGQQPAILCSPRIRLPLYQLLERHIPTVVVISYSELITDIRVEAVDTIGDNEFSEDFSFS